MTDRAVFDVDGPFGGEELSGGQVADPRLLHPVSVQLLVVESATGAADVQVPSSGKYDPVG